VHPRDPFDVLRRDVAVVEVQEEADAVFFRFVLRRLPIILPPLNRERTPKTRFRQSPSLPDRPSVG
jgi:hypothetical protein